MKRKEQYNSNKAAKVGETIVCPVCGSTFVKKSYQQAFCCGKCKDAYWNKKGDRHKNPNYHSEYNRAHPERYGRLLGLGFTRAEKDYYEGLYRLATDEGFREYMRDNAALYDGCWDGHGCNVDLLTHYENFCGDVSDDCF